MFVCLCAYRRYALQLHYASAKCRPTVCPQDGVKAESNKEAPAVSDNKEASPSSSDPDGGNRGFDCDPSVKCTEPQYWYYRKAEIQIVGNDFGDPHI